MECPACSNNHGNKVVKGLVYQCGNCGAIFGECYLGESYDYVLPYWSNEPNVPMERMRYFDLMALGSKGIERRHGWYDTQTKRIVQTG